MSWILAFPSKPVVTALTRVAARGIATVEAVTFAFQKLVPSLRRIYSGGDPGFGYSLNEATILEVDWMILFASSSRSPSWSLTWLSVAVNPVPVIEICLFDPE